MAHSPEYSDTIPPRTIQAIGAVFMESQRDPRAAHESFWANLGQSDARLVREALVIAQGCRDQGLDPGDAYLRGVAAALEANRRC